jgi:protein-disulfide isomerase
MAKTQPRRKTQQRETNWLVIGGLIGIGVLVFGGLLVLALRTPPPETVVSLADFCDANPQNCNIIGDADAPVTFVEVSDFGCPHCRDFHTQTAELIKQQYVDSGQVRWITVPYALSPATVPPAAAAMCAAEQDDYFTFAQALFSIENREERISSAGLRQAAEQTGLDIDTFTDCLDSGRHATTVSDNRDAAGRVNVTGTPTFFINGEVVSGAQPFAVFQRAIDSALSGS